MLAPQRPWQVNSLQIYAAHSDSLHTLSAFESQRGSRDTGDPEVSGPIRTQCFEASSLVIQTTNIFVANLPSNVTEATLGHFFARQGPVGSVSSLLCEAGSLPSTLHTGEDYVASV